MYDIATSPSDNVNSLFPAEHADALRAFVADFTRNGQKRDYRSDELDSLLKCFQPFSTWSRNDAVDAYYVARQLEFIRAGVQAASFPALKSSILVPMDTTPDNGKQVYTARTSKQTGRAKVTRGMGGTCPNVDVVIDEKMYYFVDIMLAYSYTLDEVRASASAGESLPTDRAMRCREQMGREVDAIALVGHTEGGLKGLFNQTTGATAVDTYTIPDGGSGTSWLTKTPAQILEDWHKSVSQIVTATLGIEEPNTTVLPLSRFEYVSTKAIGDGTIDTILTAFKRNNAHIKLVESTPYLEPSGTVAGAATTTTRMVHYERSPLKVSMIIPVVFEQLSPDVTSTETVVKTHAKTAGVIVHRPRSMLYADSI